MPIRQVLKRLFHYFLQGVIILAPIMLTLYAVSSLFTFVDNILPDVVGRIFPNWVRVDQEGTPVRIPGIGFIIVTITVVAVGYVSSSFVVGRLVDLLDTILERTPGIKILYTTLKDFFEAFAGNKRKFDKAVLVSVQDREVWQLAFITREDMKQFDLQDHIAVYVPKAYAFTGELYFVKRERVRLLPGISAAEAMKFAISGGVTELEELAADPKTP